MASISIPDKELRVRTEAKAVQVNTAIDSYGITQCGILAYVQPTEIKRVFLCKRESKISFSNKTGSVRIRAAASWTLLSWPCH